MHYFHCGKIDSIDARFPHLTSFMLFGMFDYYAGASESLDQVAARQLERLFPHLNILKLCVPMRTAASSGVGRLALDLRNR